MENATQFQDIINQIKNSVDISQIINDYINLKGQGGRFVGVCPFHNDHKPSMYVTPAIGIYKCFSCGAGGDVFSFLQEYEKISFIEALTILSEKTNIPLPKNKYYSKEELNKRKSQHQLLLDAHSHANVFFRQQLKKLQVATEYLLQRKISTESQNKFSIGFSPPTWDGLFKYLQTKNFSISDLSQINLIKKRNDTLGDTFFNRITFPIFNLSGQIIGFGGRALELKETIPKYLNSPESAIYHKSESLYGLTHARKAIQTEKSIILVEGYLDVISLHQAGIENVVAISGTALTKKHAQIISRFTSLVYLFFDGDDAGKKAIERSLPFLLKCNLEVRMIPLSNGEDPDSFIQKEKKESFKKNLMNSLNIIDFQLVDFKKNVNNYSNEKKVTLFESLKNLLQTIPSENLLQEYKAQIQKEEEEYLSKNNFISEGLFLNPSSSVPHKNQSIVKEKSLLNKSTEWQLLQITFFSSSLQFLLFDTLQGKFIDWLQEKFIQEIFEKMCIEYQYEKKIDVITIQSSLTSAQNKLLEYLQPLHNNDSLVDNGKDILRKIKQKYFQKKIKEIHRMKKLNLIDNRKWEDYIKEYQKEIISNKL